MPIMNASVQAQYISYNDEVLPVIIDDNMEGIRNIQFEAEDQAYIEYTTGMGQMADPDQSRGYFHRMKNLWEAAKARKTEEETARQARIDEAIEKEREAREQAEAKAREPYYVPPSKVDVMNRMTDEELHGFDDAISSSPALRMLWTHSNSFPEPKARIIDLMVGAGWTRERAQELFADIQVNPAPMVEPDNSGQ